MNHAKIKDTPGYVRDMSNQAVLNNDNSALDAYKKKREKQRELNSTISEINTMKQDINELKTLMQRLLEKIG